MAYKILSSKVGLDSIKRIRDILQERLGFEILVTSKAENCEGHTVLFKWGTTNKSVPALFEIQSPEFVELTKNKMAFTDFLGSVCFHPVFSNTTLPLKHEFPVVIRKTLTGKNGEGLIIANTEEEFLKNWTNESYWTPYIRNDWEVRVLVVNHKVVTIHKKLVESDEKDDNIEIRAGNSCTWVKKDLSFYPKLIAFVEGIDKKIKESYKGLIYGLDIAYDSIKKQFIIFEANSAPELLPSMENPVAEFLFENLIFND